MRLIVTDPPHPKVNKRVRRAKVVSEPFRVVSARSAVVPSGVMVLIS